MNIAKIRVIREWISAWKALWRNGWYLPASAALDLVFLVLYGFMTLPVFGALTEHIIAIGTLLSGQMRAVAGRARPAVIDALFQPPVSKYTWQFILLLVVLAVVVLVLYCVLQGLAWHIAGRVSGAKARWRWFVLHFARINLLWGGLYFLWQCASTVFELRRIAIEKALNQPAPEAGVVLSVVLAALVYFAVISYPSLSIKKAFSAGVRRIPVLVPMLLIAALQLFVCNLAVKKLAEATPRFSFIIGVILLFVLLAWTRLYVTLVVRRAG